MNIAGNPNGTASVKPLVAVQTLGCKLNQSESDSIVTRLRQLGYRVVERKKETLSEHGSEKAKYIVINTCTVTSKADRKSRYSIYRAMRYSETKESAASAAKTVPLPASMKDEHVKPIVIVTGCFVGSARTELGSMHIDYIVDNSRKSYIPEIIDAHEKQQILNFNKLPANYFNYAPSHQGFHTRSNLKIQDGCDNFCSFCIIPLVRGTAQSRPLIEIVQSARSMAEQECREIVLTGVNMSRYRDTSTEVPGTFSDLIESLLKATQSYTCRFHISSLEPDMLDDKFFDLLQNPRLCSHLHLCLQSGSDRILLKMRRMYSLSEYMNCVERIKNIDEQYNFTTDIIVGFPDEKDSDFEQSVRIAREVGFSHIHVFPFSAREGTRAKRLPPLESSVIKKRIATLQNISEEQKKQYRLSMLHTRQTVLVEKTLASTGSKITAYGLSNYYIPIEIQKRITDIRSTKISSVAKNSFVDIVPTAWKAEREPILLANASEKQEIPCS